jgi:hypothetical protein
LVKQDCSFKPGPLEEWSHLGSAPEWEGSQVSGDIREVFIDSLRMRASAKGHLRMVANKTCGTRTISCIKHAESRTSFNCCKNYGLRTTFLHSKCRKVSMNEC